MILIKLFLVFAKIGAFSIGGGYAMLPFIQKEIIEKNHWLDLKQFSDILAISQMTPGPVAVNSATFVGYKVGGVWGSVFATLGVVLPSFLMILIIAAFFSKFYERKSVKSAFLGIRPVVIGLLGSAALQVTLTNVTSVKDILIFTAGFSVLFIKKADPIYVLIASAILGIIFY